jgi:hypothetical protein
MARKSKSQGVSLEDLMVAQQRMMEGGRLSERQLEVAQQQLNKLGEIKTALVVGDLEDAKQDIDIQRITNLRRDPRAVGLTDVKTEIKNLNEELRRRLPNIKDQEKKQEREQTSEEIEKEAQEERTQRLEKLAEVIGKKTSLEKGGSRNEILTERNRSTFERFIQETARRDELLAEANQDQQEIFKRVEATLIKLQEADSKDSKELRRELEKLSGALQETKESQAKQGLVNIVENARTNAARGTGGRNGSFGDVIAALMGRQSALKAGVRQTDAGFVDKTGASIPEAEARQSRIGSAGTIFANLLGEKIEQGYENKRSPAIQKFFDVFRTSERLAAPNISQGRQSQLMKASGIEARASGGPIVSGRPYLVGENGPELIIPNTSGRVEPLPTATAEPKTNAMFSDAGGVTTEKDPAEKIVAAVKEVRDAILSTSGGSGLELPGIGLDPRGSRGGKNPPKPGRPGTPRAGGGVMGGAINLLGMFIGETYIRELEADAREKRNEKYDAMIASGDPEQMAKGQAMKEQEMSTLERLGKIKDDWDKLHEPERMERLKDAPWYTRHLGIGEDSVQPVQRPPVGSQINNQSIMNQNMQSMNQAPVIINAPQIAAAEAGSKDGLIAVQRASVRPEESAWDHHMRRIYTPF